jgi:Ser/Thr protein kinase RdoA (MazF antagonist)
MTIDDLAFTIANEFQLSGSVIDVHRYGHGLIHDTFLVTTDAEQVILQRVNQRAFPEPELIMRNLRVLHDHVRTVRGGTLRLPPVIIARDGCDFVLDRDRGFWRALGFIEDTETFTTIRDTAQAGEVGAALGQFHAMVCELNPERLRVTRPGFHQTPQYYARYTAAAARPREHEPPELKWCLAFAGARRGMVAVLEDAKQSGALTPRVIHGDPKLDNFLFSPETREAVSLIDLDTVQPGLLHYDVGDCLRSCANPAGESPQDAARARFHLDIAEAMLARYLEETRGLLSADDIVHFYDAMRLIPFELGLRFLTDHLEGDVYFRTEWRGQNLHRALVQFRLTEDIERNERAIRTLIADLSGEGA